MLARLFLLSFHSTLLLGAPLAAHASPAPETRTALKVASAQFPAPRTDETEQEWRSFLFSYAEKHLPATPNFEPPFAMPSGQANARIARGQVYSEFDAEGRPMWFGGSRDAELRTIIITLLRQDQFEALEKLLDEWDRRSERTADGKWKLDSFFDALDSLFKDRWPDEIHRIERWRSQRPNSPLAAIAEARYWQSFAWVARGGGYADTVDGKGWMLFHERSRKGEEVLLASSSYASSHPLWGTVYLQLGAGLNWSVEDEFRLFRTLNAANKHFYQYYFTMTKYASPKWGGDWDLVDVLARQAEAATKDTDGAALYTRVYWSAYNSNRSVDFFNETKVEWAHMKRGFDDLMARYPHSVWNANHYAAFACAAGDGEIYRKMRQLIGDNIEKAAWHKGRTLEECDAKFPQLKAGVGAPALRAPTQLKAAFRPSTPQ